ncbi:hypothetical protein HDU82_006024 [Entophlyctis luteolus]|nr:hypothetical protein HDU82_006024 [Entophlyctis luteolus]
MSAPASTAVDKWTALPAPAHAQTSAVVRYTREVLLARFHDCLLDPPADLDQSLSIFIQTALDPVANVPLSDFERKILTLGAVNSELSTRRNYGSRNNADDSNSPAAKSYQRHNSSSNVSSRGGRGGFSTGRRHNSERFDRKPDGYDSPEKHTAVLNVSSASPQPISEPIDTIASAEKSAVDSTISVPKPSTAVLENSLPIAAKATNLVPDKPLEFSSPSRHSSSIFDPKIADVFSSMNITSNLSSAPASSLLKQSILGTAPVPVGTFTDIAAADRIVSSYWFYKDPLGTIQGPFSTEQMQDWFSKSFFSEDLPIKRDQDLAFEPLANLLLRFGRDRPFINSEEAERSVLPAHINARLPSVSGANGLSDANGFSPFVGAALKEQPTATNRFSPAPSASFYGNDYRHDIIFGGVEPAVPQVWGSPIESNNFGLARGSSSPFGQQVPDLVGHQQQYQPVYNPITSGIIPPPQAPFTQFSTPLNPQFESAAQISNHWTANAGVPSQQPQVLPSVEMLRTGEPTIVLPAEPQPAKVVEEELLQSPKKAPAHDPSPVRKPSPPREPSAVLAVREPSPRRPEVAQVTEVKSKTKKSGQNVKKQVIPVTVHSEPPQQIMNSKNSFPIAAPISTSASSAQSVPSSAPWAAASPSKPSVQKMSLKEVQEMEQREAQQREREKARKAHAKLMAEAQALAELKATNAVVNSGGTVWNSGQTKKKSLADIMKEEETKKKGTQEAANTAGSTASGAGGNSHVDSITASEIGTVNSPGKPPVASGWTVVGVAPNKRVQPVSTATSVSRVVGSHPSAINPIAPKSAVRNVAITSVNVVANRPVPVEKSVLNGISPGFLQWLRQALLPLGRSTTAGVQVDEFIQILLTVPTNETRTISMICDDTLGGLTAIDPIKFADEFVRRRKADAANDPAAWAAGGSATVAGTGSAIGGKASGEVGSGGFVVVGKKKGKK